MPLATAFSKKGECQLILSTATFAMNQKTNPNHEKTHHESLDPYGAAWRCLDCPNDCNQNHTVMNYERKLSLMTTAEIQRDLDLIRLAYRDRDMNPRNRRRIPLRALYAVGLVLIMTAIRFF